MKRFMGVVKLSIVRLGSNCTTSHIDHFNFSGILRFEEQEREYFVNMEFVSEGPENIWTAASDGDLNRVAELINEGVNVNIQDDHAAASYGHLEVIKYLLSKGADPNLRDKEGDTPILVAELPEVFEYLKSVGSDPEATNNDKQGILQKAVEDENEDLIIYLIQNGYVTDPNFKFTPGQFELNMVENNEFDTIDEEDEEEEEEDGNDAVMKD